MTNKYLVNVGDIIIKPFKNEKGEWVKSHPLVVTHIDEKGILSAWDSQAIMAAIAMSDIKSTKSKELLSRQLSSVDIIVDKEDGVRKTPLLQLEVVILFAKDVLPVDFQGQLNPAKVRIAIEVIEELHSQKLLKINKHSLPSISSNLEIRENEKVQKDDEKSR